MVTSPLENCCILNFDIEWGKTAGGIVEYTSLFSCEVAYTENDVPSNMFFIDINKLQGF
jgi:hypothetical protein